MKASIEADGRSPLPRKLRPLPFKHPSASVEVNLRPPTFTEAPSYFRLLVLTFMEVDLPQCYLKVGQLPCT